MVPANQAALLRVLNELLSNAVRHARTRVEVVAEPSSLGGCRITVTDDGPGIPAAARPRLFEAFALSDDAATEGSGLGLYIARALVAGHRGTLTVEDAPGGGARFTIRLPG